MRTIDEIRADVSIGIGMNDAPKLLRLAAELDELATPEAIAAAHGARGWACNCTGDYPAALEHFNKALALHSELGNRRSVAGVTGNIGIVYERTGDYPAALEHYNSALTLNQELGYRSSVATITGNIGNVYLNTGDFPAALEHYNSALALYRELGDSIGLAGVTGNVGIVYQKTSDFPAALEHYNKALTLHEELGDRSGVARVTGNIGTVYFDTGNFPAALDHYNTALALHNELGERSGVAAVISNILPSHLGNSDLDSAMKTLADLDQLSVDNPFVAVQREIGRSKIYVLQADLSAAQTTLASALELASTHGLRSQQADVYKELRDLAQKRNDFAAYIEYNNDYTRVNEEIRGKETSIKLAMQAKERELAEKDKEVAKHMAVLHSTLPKLIADRVARGEVVNDHYDNAAVLFLDIVGFTSISDRIPAGHVVHLLDQIFTALDALCEQHNITKIKTIGDSYMAVGFENNTAERVASCAVDMIASLNSLVINLPAGLGDTTWTKDVGDIRVRIGLHVGPVTAGVIGTQRMQYDVWGDTVNIASRMESTGEPGRIQVSETFASLFTPSPVKSTSPSSPLFDVNTSPPSPLSSLRGGTNLTPLELEMGGAEGAGEWYQLIRRGEIDIKGKGPMNTYWLEGTL